MEQLRMEWLLLFRIECFLLDLGSCTFTIPGIPLYKLVVLCRGWIRIRERSIRM